MAPETAAPRAAEDGCTAYRRISDNATEPGIATTRVGLAGRSGGGGIAAATALLIRDRGTATPLFQLLMTRCSTTATRPTRATRSPTSASGTARPTSWPGRRSSATASALTT
ncbi:alpha/beta hydrolase fold domain-containing protein [Streptomyces sp. NPDC048623]|uniref:alpha/beta hydrolase fold domain-containing protein n=1 Tax=Streptomyces sp. NPDC048623 TaxID=3155761 RepID=UPI003429B1B9